MVNPANKHKCGGDGGGTGVRGGGGGRGGGSKRQNASTPALLRGAHTEHAVAREARVALALPVAEAHRDELPHAVLPALAIRHSISAPRQGRGTPRSATPGALFGYKCNVWGRERPPTRYLLYIPGYIYISRVEENGLS